MGVLEAGVILGVQTAHGIQRSFDGVDHIGHPDRAGVPGQPATAARPPKTLHQPGLVQGPELLLEEAQRDVLGLGQCTGRHQAIALAGPADGQLDGCTHGVFGSLRDLEHRPGLLGSR
jgi:hypothetical protein